MTYIVTFISRLRSGIGAQYKKLAHDMEVLARQQPGFLDMDSVRNSDGDGITISYWETLEAIKNWGKHPDHLKAQKKIGRAHV